MAEDRPLEQADASPALVELANPDEVHEFIQRVNAKVNELEELLLTAPALRFAPKSPRKR